MFINKISMSQTCLYSISYQKAMYRIFTTTSRYRGHSTIVRHNTNLATVYTVGGWSVEYEYKLLHQFTVTVGGTRCQQSHRAEPEQLTAGPHKVFLLIISE